VEDLLRALIQGDQPQPSQYDVRGGAVDLGQMLQGLLGGATSLQEAAQAGPDQEGLDLGSLLQGVLGGAGQPAPSHGEQEAGTGPGAAGLDLASLLGGGPATGGQAQQAFGETGAGSGPPDLNLASLLGDGPPAGGQAPQTHDETGTGPAQAGLDLASLLQAVLGGGDIGGSALPASSEGGGFGDLLGGIMGGGSSTMASDQFLSPIVDGLSEKLELPPQIVQAVVAFVMGKLLGNRLQPGGASSPAPARSSVTRRRDVTVEDIRQKMNRHRRVTKKELRKSGLVRELAASTGLDRATAEASLQEVLNQLGDQLGAGE
jgi:hypothetical protein